MELKDHPSIDISNDLIEAIRSLPRQREIEHCGARISVSPFDFYAECPRCGSRIKTRAFSAGAEVEDVFDAVFEWLNQPGAQELGRRRQEVIATDTNE
jgi:hypothetical protein